MVQWKVFLIANLRDNPITEFRIEVSPDPYHIIYTLNQFTVPFNQRWTVLQCIHLPPMVSERTARAIGESWRKKTRSLPRYLAKSFYLVNGLSATTLEVTNLSRCEQLETIGRYHNHNVLDAPPIPNFQEFMELKENKQTFISECERNFQEKFKQLPAETQKKPSIADFVRMYDIQHETLYKTPTLLLERFINISATATTTPTTSFG